MTIQPESSPLLSRHLPCVRHAGTRGISIETSGVLISRIMAPETHHCLLTLFRILDFSTTTFVVRVHSPGASGAKNDDSAVVLPSESDSIAPDQNGVHSAGPSAAKRKHAHEMEGQEFGTRRSKRTKSIKKPYKEIKIPVSKWDTVMDLKLKVQLWQLKGR